MRLVLALALLALVPATAAAQDPGVTTGPAQGVGVGAATLTGTVDPNVVATTYRFEYGTTTAYGLETPVQPAGAGDAEVPVQATVENLTAATTYHYRLVARGVAGADRTFKTAANPAPPTITRVRTIEKTATSAGLTARINPKRAETTYFLEWGTSTSFGNRTPEQTLPAGSVRVPVSAPLVGLRPYTRIHWRVVATNAAGVTRSGTASFTTLRALSGVTLSVFPATTDWSGTVSISGRVEGTGVNGVRVALEQTSFPFDRAFHEVATVRAGTTGEFRFAARPVFLATHYRAVTRTTVPATSPEIAAQVRARAGLHRAGRTRRSQRLVGQVHPGLPSGRATLQRRTRSGGWARVRSKPVSTPSVNVSTYAFTVRRARRPATYRVLVDPRDAGAHARGISRGVRVGRRRQQRNRPAMLAEPDRSAG